MPVLHSKVYTIPFSLLNGQWNRIFVEFLLSMIVKTNLIENQKKAISLKLVSQLHEGNQLFFEKKVSLDAFVFYNFLCITVIRLINITHIYIHAFIK